MLRAGTWARLVALQCALAALGALGYRDIDDSFDFESVLRNRTLLHQFFGCFLGDACSDVASHVRDHFSEILTDGCAGCDRTQKHYAHAFFSALREQIPDEYRSIRDKFDPRSDSLTRFEHAVEPYR